VAVNFEIPEWYLDNSVSGLLFFEATVTHKIVLVSPMEFQNLQTCYGEVFSTEISYGNRKYGDSDGTATEVG
jgi:hypothetical protein